MKILIIEDEYDLTEALIEGFRSCGYIAEYALDGEQGLEMALVNEYDLIILDLNLPKLDGLKVLEELRRHSQDQRILILSARSSVAERVEGLNLGANDYLPKPFAFAELEARVRSLLRRSYIQKDSVLTCHGIRLDTNTREVSVNGKPLALSPKEYAILEYLLLNMDKTISAETLIEHVWYSDTDYFSASVKVHLSTLRRKLMSVCGKEIITTVRGSGYLIRSED